MAIEADSWVVGEDGSGKIQGRMKFCRPILRLAKRANPEDTKKLFVKHKFEFHPIARKLLEKVRGLFFTAAHLWRLTNHQDLGLTDEAS